MEIPFDDEQKLLKESAQRLIERHGGAARRRTIRADGTGIDQDRMRILAEAGWFGLLVPEKAGGLGLGTTELAIVLEEAGRGLLTEPVSALAAAARALAVGDAQTCGPWLDGLLAGKRIVVPAFVLRTDKGQNNEAMPEEDGFRLSCIRETVPCAAAADAYLVDARTGYGTIIGIVPKGSAGVSVESAGTVDGCHHARLRFENVALSAGAVLAGPNAGDALAQELFDRVLIGVSAEMLGVMEQALDVAISYLKLREQFGRPIGSFQALQHRAVDDHIKVELTRSLLYQVCAAVDDGRSTRSMVAALKAQASDAVLDVTKSTIQMHGAIGFTDEHDIGLYLRRAMALAPLYGTAGLHRARFSALTPA